MLIVHIKDGFTGFEGLNLAGKDEGDGEPDFT